MKYPCFRLSQGRTALANHKDDRNPTLGSVAPELRNADGDLDADEVEDLLREVKKKVSSSQAQKLKTRGVSPDQVEGMLALELHSSLMSLPATCLTDPDFWRYISVEVVRDFVFWRDGVDCSYASFGLSSSRRIPDCVPLRMFNRAHLARLIDPQDLDRQIQIVKAGGADFWQSHVLRVQNRFDPRIVLSLVVALETSALENVQDLRDVAKDIRRLRANVILELQTEKELERSIKSAVSSQGAKK